jgi:STE24 endopeptidase
MQTLAIAMFVAVVLARQGLAWLNLRHLAREGHRVPAPLAGEIDAERLRKISDYTTDRSRFGLWHAALWALFTGTFVFAGGLRWYDSQVTAVARSFVGSGVIFVLGLMLGGALLEIPFQLYGTFVVEARHGFNRQSWSLWWSDWLKSTLLSALFASGLSAAALWLVTAAQHTWWIWVSALVSGTSLIMTFISPYVIEPLFHKLEPLNEPSMADAIRNMTEKAGVSVGRVLKLDASRRSGHSNAYFTGLGRVKRVVLFDTLLAQMSRPQVLAVLAHELGHWKKHHVLVRMLVMQVLLVVAAYLAFRLLPSAALPELVGAPQLTFAARALVLMLIASTALFPLTPLFSAWSRRDEREADRFAVELHGRATDLADALAKLGTENLSNLHPHPLYAAFYYSHPPLAERIGALRAAD